MPCPKTSFETKDGQSSNFLEVLSSFFGNIVKSRASIEAKGGLDNHMYKEEKQ